MHPLENNLNLIKSSTLLASIFDVLGLNYSVIDSQGDYIVQNNGSVSKISSGHMNAAQVDPITWEDCKNVMIKKERTIIEEQFKERYYLSIKQPLYDNSHCMGILIVSLDITDKKKAELAKQALLENARHDIRTPFSGIVGFAQLVHSTNDINKIKEYTQDLVLSTEEFLEYHNKLLEAIKVADNAHGVFQKRKLNLMEEMVSVIDINKLAAMTKGIELDLIYDKNILAYPYFISDPIQVHRIALELVTNAIKFTEKGKVELKVNIKKKDLKKSIIEISVSDTGIGIPVDK